MHPQENLPRLPDEQSTTKAPGCKLVNAEVPSHWCLQSRPGRFGFASITFAQGANITNIQLLNFSCQGKYLCRIQGQIALLSSAFLVFNCQANAGTGISISKKKKMEWVSFSKARSASISLTLGLALRASALLFLPSGPPRRSRYFLLESNHHSFVAPFIVSHKFPVLWLPKHRMSLFKNDVFYKSIDI